MTRKLFFIFSIFILGACLTPDNIQLDEAEKNAQIQELATVEMKKMKPLLEIGCDENFDKLVDRAVDSLVNVYLDSTKYEY
jgi:hypothetical protein